MTLTRPTDVPTLSPIVVPGEHTGILSRWREVVRALPDAPSVASAGVTYTFAEVDRLSDVMASDVLDRIADGDDRPIGALIAHDANAVIAGLAVIKTGRLLVVLDGHMPADRLGVYAEMAGLATVVADDAYAAHLPSLPGIETVIGLQDLVAAASISDRAVTEQDLPGTARGGRDGYCIIFTSGSSGKPKGVLQLHQSMLNDAANQGTITGISPADRSIGVMPLGFVFGLPNLMALLLNGASVWLFDPRDHGLAELRDWITDNRLTTIHSTPYVTRSLAESLPEGEILDTIRMFLTGGEAMSARDAALVRDRLPKDALFVNANGSTECSLLTAWTLQGGEPLPTGTIPAGKVAKNKEFLLLGEDGTPVAQGETGELAIISDYISGGYWNDPEKNATTFVTDDQGRHMFLQGDLGRIDENGDLVLGGRADSSVKVRGYLVEPGEIEAVLQTIDEILDAVVVASKQEDEQTRLIAYVAAKPGLRAPSNAQIRRILRQSIPEYMIPGEIVQLATMPRTERGKIDRRALPPVPERVVDFYEMNQREVAMSTIWQQVLELPAVGLDDDFMALGGDSLSTEELVQVVRERFDVIVPANEILSFPTLREFTKRVVSGSAALPSHPDIVTLNAIGTETPVFCFAGGGALALTFMPLSRHFPNTPVYAFQAHGLEERAIPDWSVEAMATRFIRLMRIVRPSGPYRLAGHSFGGLIALEVARQLNAAGQEVQSLAILDTYLPRNVDTSEELTPTVSTAAAPPTASLPSIVNPIGVARGLKQRFVPDGLPRGENIGRQARAYFGGILKFPGQQQYASFLDRAALIGRKYVLRPYSGKTVVILTESNPDSTSVWDGILTGEHEFRRMDTEHTQLLREPHVSELATYLKKVFAPVDA